MREEGKNKIPMDLITPSMLEGLATGLGLGAKKYGAGNYISVSIEEFFGSILRHYSAIRKGEIIDPDSGIPHHMLLLSNAAIICEKMSTEREVNHAY